MSKSTFFVVLLETIIERRPDRSIRVRTKTGDTYDPAYVRDIHKGVVTLRYDSDGSGLANCSVLLLISQIESIWVQGSPESPEETKR